METYGAGPYRATDLVQGRQAVTDTASYNLFPATDSEYRNWISLITVSNTSAVDTQVQILSGSSPIWTVPAPSHGGAIVPFPHPIKGNPGEAINFSVDNSATTVTVSAAGYRAQLT